jgi:hypothetical protein
MRSRSGSLRRLTAKAKEAQSINVEGQTLATPDLRFSPVLEHGGKEFSFQCQRYIIPLTATRDYAISASSRSSWARESTTTIPFTNPKAGSRPSKSIRNVTFSFTAQKVTSELGVVKADGRPLRWACGSSTSSTKEVRPILSDGFHSATDGGRGALQTGLPEMLRHSGSPIINPTS